MQTSLFLGGGSQTTKKKTSSSKRTSSAKKSSSSKKSASSSSKVQVRGYSRKQGRLPKRHPKGSRKGGQFRKGG